MEVRQSMNQKAAEPLWAQGRAEVAQELRPIGALTRVLASLAENTERHFRTGFVRVASVRDIRALLGDDQR